MIRSATSSKGAMVAPTAMEARAAATVASGESRVPPRRDRFSSGSRSVQFRLEIGPVPRRDRSGFAPKSVQIRSRVNSADMNVPGSGIGSDSASGHGQPLRRVRVTSDQAFGLAESRSRISVRSSMSVTFLASSSAFSLARRSLTLFIGMTMAK